jgi:hypothetical protein
VKQFGEIAKQKGHQVKGVVGISALFDLDGFDIIKSMPVEPMHAIDINMSRLLCDVSGTN